MNSDTLKSDACGGPDDMTDQLAGFRYDPDGGERLVLRSCGWQYASSDPDEAAARWEKHARSLWVEDPGGASEA